MLPTGGRGQRAVQDRLRLHDAGAGGRCSGSGVPQRPRGDVQQRVGRQGLYVDVVRVGRAECDHGVGVARVTRTERFGVGRVGGGKAGRQGAGQTAFDRIRPAVGGQSEFHAGPCQRGREVDRVECLPGLVVVGPDRVGDAPPRNGEVGVERQSALETADRFLVIERVGPDHAAVEPRLGLGRRGVNQPLIGPEVVVRFGRSQRSGYRHGSHDNSVSDAVRQNGSAWRQRRARNPPPPRPPG